MTDDERLSPTDAAAGGGDASANEPSAAAETSAQEAAANGHAETNSGSAETSQAGAGRADAQPADASTAEGKPVPAFFIFQAILLTAAIGYGGWRYAAIEREHRLPAVIEFSQPREVGPLHDDPRVVSDADLRAVLRRVVPRFQGAKTPLYDIDHAFRLWGPAKVFGRDPDGMPGHFLRSVLLDDAAFRGLYGAEVDSLLEDTPQGVSVSVREHPVHSSSHVDHVLGCLAEAGVSLDEPVYTAKGERQVRDLLRRSLYDFSLNQAEPEWSILCYLLYMSPDTHWFTAEGQRIDFDVLAERLMRQDMPQGSCSAHHRLHTLVMMLRVDAEEPFLSDQTREEVRAYLSKITRRLIETQHADGYWNTIWTGEVRPEGPPPDADSLSNRLLVTGHVLEWWALAPDEVGPGQREPVVRAGQWLVRTILDLDAQQLKANFAFLSHCARALALWRGQYPHEIDIYEGAPEPPELTESPISGLELPEPKPKPKSQPQADPKSTSQPRSEPTPEPTSEATVPSSE